MARNEKQATGSLAEALSELSDPLDAEIVKLLRRNGRMTNREIARKVGVAEGTIRNRVRKLLDNGVMAIVAVTDLSKLGYPIDVTIGIEVEPSRLLEVAHALVRLDQVRYVNITTGAYDILAAAYFKSKEEQLKFHTVKLAKIGGIQRTHTSTSLKILKRNFEWVPADIPEQSEDTD